MAVARSSHGATPLPVAAARSPVGVVAAGQRAAADAGAEILRKGGNAIDAAVAAAFVAGVVEPHRNGLGGGGFMLVRSADTGLVTAIDYRETAPARATRDMFLDSSGNVLPEASKHSHRAAATPGTLAGLCLALERFGTLPLATVLQRAIHHAEHGFPARGDFLARSWRERNLLLSRPETTRHYLAPDRNPVADGAIIYQHDLGRTLRRIAEEGPACFYTGPLALAIAAEMRTGDGLIDEADLAAYRPRLRQPLRRTYRGHDVITMPPPSSGGIMLLQMLAILDGLRHSTDGPAHPRNLHLLAETMRRVFADRAEHLGDPDLVNVPVDWLLSRGYADWRRASVDAARATPSSAIRPGCPPAESDNTTHISAMDARGNVASLTQTINFSFGCGVIVPGTGILLNNQMDDFSAKPGAPNLFELTGGAANCIAPGKVPLSSMAPTIVERDGRPLLALGTPGGSCIPTIILQVLLHVIDHGASLEQAVAAPRLHHQWLPDELRLETDLWPDAVYSALRDMGHHVVEKPGTGNVTAVARESDGLLVGVPDPRGGGRAAG